MVYPKKYGLYCIFAKNNFPSMRVSDETMLLTFCSITATKNKKIMNMIRPEERAGCLCAEESYCITEKL
jgi:hypothetical protein